MKKIWNFCISKNWKMSTKKNVFMFINLFISFVVSTIVWFITKNVIVEFDAIGWYVCFVGYFMIIDYIFATVFVFSNE